MKFDDVSVTGLTNYGCMPLFFANNLICAASFVWILTLYESRCFYNFLLYYYCDSKNPEKKTQLKIDWNCRRDLFKLLYLFNYRPRICWLTFVYYDYFLNLDSYLFACEYLGYIRDSSALITSSQRAHVFVPTRPVICEFSRIMTLYRSDIKCLWCKGTQAPVMLPLWNVGPLTLFSLRAFKPC